MPIVGMLPVLAVTKRESGFSHTETGAVDGVFGEKGGEDGLAFVAKGSEPP